MDNPSADETIESAPVLRDRLKGYLATGKDFVAVTPLCHIADMLMDVLDEKEMSVEYGPKCLLTETLYPGDMCLAFFVLPKKLAAEVANRFHRHDLMLASSLEERLVGNRIHVMDTDEDNNKRAYGIGTWLDGLLS